MVLSSFVVCLSMAALALGSPIEQRDPFPIIKIVARQNGTSSPPVNSATLQLIESEEGFSANFYTIDGDETIGYGHDCTQRQDCGSIDAPITQAQGQDLLIQDLPDYTSCVCALPNSSGLNANQFGALASFTYNAGCGGVQDAFESYMENSDYSGICAALPNTYTNGGELSSRRQREADLCNTATSDPSGC